MNEIIKVCLDTFIMVAELNELERLKLDAVKQQNYADAAKYREQELEVAQRLINAMLTDAYKQRDEFLLPFLRERATPPIKGEITRGKIKWRGIVLCCSFEQSDTRYWMEQRGKRISPDFIIKAPSVTL